MEREKDRFENYSYSRVYIPDYQLGVTRRESSA